MAEAGPLLGHCWTDIRCQKEQSRTPRGDLPQVEGRSGELVSPCPAPAMPLKRHPPPSPTSQGTPGTAATTCGSAQTSSRP